MKTVKKQDVEQIADSIFRMPPTERRALLDLLKQKHREQAEISDDPEISRKALVALMGEISTKK